MATTQIAKQQLLIGGELDGRPRAGREYEQGFPFTGEAVGAGCGSRDGRTRALRSRRPRAAFAEWSASAPAVRTSDPVTKQPIS